LVYAFILFFSEFEAAGMNPHSSIVHSNISAQDRMMRVVGVNLFIGTPRKIIYIVK
jgi:hypothetical protein